MASGEIPVHCWFRAKPEETFAYCSLATCILLRQNIQKQLTCMLGIERKETRSNSLLGREGYLGLLTVVTTAVSGVAAWADAWYDAVRTCNQKSQWSRIVCHLDPSNSVWSTKCKLVLKYKHYQFGKYNRKHQLHENSSGPLKEALIQKKKLPSNCWGFWNTPPAISAKHAPSWSPPRLHRRPRTRHLHEARPLTWRGTSLHSHDESFHSLPSRWKYSYISPFSERGMDTWWVLSLNFHPLHLCVWIYPTMEGRNRSNGTRSYCVFHALVLFSKMTTFLHWVN